MKIKFIRQLQIISGHNEMEQTPVILIWPIKFRWFPLILFIGGFSLRNGCFFLLNICFEMSHKIRFWSCLILRTSATIIIYYGQFSVWLLLKIHHGYRLSSAKGIFTVLIHMVFIMSYQYPLATDSKYLKVVQYSSEIVLFYQRKSSLVSLLWEYDKGLCRSLVG